MMRLPDSARAALFALALAAFAGGAALAQPGSVAPEPAAPAALALGSTAPAAGTPMRNVDGRDVTIAGAAGKRGTLVLFICNHCPWVKAWQGRIADVGRLARAKGVGVIAINSNDPAAYPEDTLAVMVERAKEVGYTFAYAVDAASDVARAFGASHTPEAFLFDGRGRLVYHGAVDDNARQPEAVKSRFLADAVTAVAAGKPVPRAETKALGCGIKFRGGAAPGTAK